MAAPDLYADLGLGRDVSPEAIHKAYRKKARKAHPDAGGSPDAFHAIVLAHDVLSDPARRAKYDATGTIDPSAPDNVLANMIEHIARAFNAAVTQAFQMGQDPTRVDILNLMIDGLLAEEHGIAKHQAQFALNRKMMQSMLGRFTAPAGKPNHIENGIRGQIVELERQVAQNEVALEQKRAPRLYLQGCKFRKEEPVMPQGFHGFININIGGAAL